MEIQPEMDINRAFEAYRSCPSQTSLEEVTVCGEVLVRHFVRVYGNGFNFDDLYQSGMVGLLRAVKSYDGSSQFSTWASNCIIGEIRHYVRRESVHAACEQARELHETDADTTETWLPDAAPCEPMRSFHLRVEDRVLLEQAMKKLTELEQSVLSALFYRGLTQQQTAEELGMSQRGVSRTLKKTLSSLAKILEGPSFKLIDSTKSFKNIKK